MSEQPAPPPFLEQVSVVLYEPQKPINIAGTVRAMKNMGVHDLRLVRPCAYDENFIEVIAHKTRDVAERIRHFDTLDAALADCVRVVAFTGRRRAARWPFATPREAAADLKAFAADGRVALLFGREDDGLPGDAVDRAALAVTIPTTAHTSLNVAQAVLVALYEVHLAAGDATVPLGRSRKHAPPPTGEQYEHFYASAEQALAALDFFKTRNVEHIMRSLRSQVYRAGLDGREIDLGRAMAIEVLRTLERETTRARREGWEAGFEAGREAAARAGAERPGEGTPA
jgi:TrmH family RNA methyltransferase